MCNTRRTSVAKQVEHEPKLNTSSSLQMRIPNLPLRPRWINNAIVDMYNDSLPIESVDTVMRAWNQWTDTIEDVFRTMNRQSDSLDVSIDDYIGWIGNFSNHSERPSMSSAEEARDRMTGVSLIPPMRAHSRWEAFADELEQTYTIMARELGYCKPRQGGAHEVVDCNIETLDFSQMSLSNGTATVNQIKGVLSAMLGPGRSFHRVSRDAHVPFSGDHQDPEQSSSNEWAAEFLATLREINREMEEEDYRELNLEDLDIGEHETDN